MDQEREKELDREENFSRHGNLRQCRPEILHCPDVHPRGERRHKPAIEKNQMRDALHVCTRHPRGDERKHRADVNGEAYALVRKRIARSDDAPPIRNGAGIQSARRYETKMTTVHPHKNATSSTLTRSSSRVRGKAARNGGFSQL